jgi:iron(III) transport system ATP-binding protein
MNRSLLAPVSRKSAVLKVDSLYTEYLNELGQPVKAAQDINIDVPEGHFFTLLGPSGCGKTTTLRSIAGLERPKSGTITVNNVVVYSGVSGTPNVFVPPNQRGFGMVFQSYAIWPHMDVFTNTAFPLQVGKKKYSRAEIDGKVMRVLKRCSSITCATARRPSSPAASSSAWPWPAPW